MKELNKWQNLLFRIGALLMLIGISINIFSPIYSFCIYSIGTAMFTSMQLYAQYLGNDAVVVRLRRQQLLSCVFFVVTAVLMCLRFFHFRYASRNEWVIALTIACLLQVYTSWRIPVALSKAKKS